MINASFTPFVVTADGALGIEAKTFMRHLAEKIAAIWHKSNSEVLGYVHARMLFAVLRATNLCIRGSRVKWRRMEIEDGEDTCQNEFQHCFSCFCFFYFYLYFKLST